MTAKELMKLPVKERRPIVEAQVDAFLAAGGYEDDEVELWAFCCPGDPRTCDCVNKSHGLVRKEQTRKDTIQALICPHCQHAIRETFVGSWVCDCRTGLSRAELDAKFPQNNQILPQTGL